MADAQAAAGEVELPKALLKRIVKAKLGEISGDAGKEYSINKDALLAFSESAKVFISFIASTANDIAKESKRQTMSAEDVFKALDEMEFSDMVEPVREFLKGQKEAAKSKQQKKQPADKKRKAPAGKGAAGQEDAEMEEADG